MSRCSSSRIFLVTRTTRQALSSAVLQFDFSLIENTHFCKAFTFGFPATRTDFSPSKYSKGSTSSIDSFCPVCVVCAFHNLLISFIAKGNVCFSNGFPISSPSIVNLSLLSDSSWCSQRKNCHLREIVNFDFPFVPRFHLVVFMLRDKRVSMWSGNSA